MIARLIRFYNTHPDALVARICIPAALTLMVASHFFPV